MGNRIAVVTFMEKRVLHSAVVAILVLMLCAATASAGTFYVRVDGSDSNTGLTNDSSGAWRTINYAASRVAPGDTVRVQAGTYAERVSPGVNGSLGNPITLVADGVVTMCSISIVSKNYLRFIGFVIDGDGGGCPASNRAVLLDGTGTGLEFWNNTIRDETVGISGNSYDDRQHNTVIIGNKFIALGNAVGLRGNNNVIAYNDVLNATPDAFIIDGAYSYWLNNYNHEPLDPTDGHSDVFQGASSTLGLQFNVFEGNLAIGNGGLLNEHGVLLRNESSASCSTLPCGPMKENLFRRNVWHNISGGHLGIGPSQLADISNTREVHDTVVLTHRNAPLATASATFVGTSGTTASIHNNLFYQAWGTSVTTNARAYYVQGGAVITSANHNLAYDPDDSVTFTTPLTSEANGLSNVEPAITNVASADFSIGSGSGARNAGGPLTTTSGSGTGTTFRVATGGGGWFRGPNTNIAQYGGNLTAGDVITVGTDTVTVVSVSGDAITVTPSFAWSDGEPVYWGDDPTPDVGAYPYKAGGYGLSATHAISGSTATVTPNDASLVRFVVCFSDGMPYSVDNSSPYTCGAQAGTFSANVYPRYASKTLWVTVGGTGGATLTAPKNLKLSGS